MIAHPVVAPPDPATDAFLHLVDSLDSEANAVTRAVVLAQAAVRSIINDAQVLLCGSETDIRAWAEVGVRLLQHRATLLDALSGLCRSGVYQAADGAAPVPATSIPIPPRPVRFDHTHVAGRLSQIVSIAEDNKAGTRPTTTIPPPPRPRHLGLTRP